MIGRAALPGGRGVLGLVPLPSVSCGVRSRPRAGRSVSVVLAAVAVAALSLTLGASPGFAKVRAVSVTVSVHVTSSGSGHRVLVVARIGPVQVCWGGLAPPPRASGPAYAGVTLPQRSTAADGAARWRLVISAVAPPGLWTATVTCSAGRYRTRTSRFRVPEPGQVTQSSFGKPPRDSIGGFGYPRFGAVLVPGADWLSGHGVTVYSNNRCARHWACASGQLGAYGWGRQSVELFERFMNTEGWYHGIITPGGNGGAQNLWTSAPSSAFEKYPNGHVGLPVPGDAVIFGGGAYGHVAIVEWSGFGYVGIVEQNGSASGRAVLPLSGINIDAALNNSDGTLGGEDGLRVIGILHATANPYQFLGPAAHVYELAFQARSGDLWSSGYDDHRAWTYRMMADSSPSIAAIAGGGYEIAFQADTGHLWLVGTAGTVDTGRLIAQGTSPSITALPDGGFEVAFQASDGHMWTIGSDMHGDWGYPVRSGTSPSITETPNGANGLNYEVAFQASSGNLSSVGSDMHGDWGVQMATGTSPSVTQAPAGSNGLDYEVAFQASGGNLWSVGSDMHGDWGFQMRTGTSPSITQTPTGSNGLTYEVAFQASSGSLWTVGYDSQGTNWNQVMMGDTSPSIAHTPMIPSDVPPQYELAVTDPDGYVLRGGADDYYNEPAPTLRSQTSPSITGRGSGPTQLGGDVGWAQGA